jgi:hypothetical protein
LRKTADAKIRCRDIDLLTLFTLKQVIQYIGEAIFDVVDDVRYVHHDDVAPVGFGIGIHSSSVISSQSSFASSSIVRISSRLSTCIMQPFSSGIEANACRLHPM